jgi:hypothetical protein
MIHLIVAAALAAAAAPPAGQPTAGPAAAAPALDSYTTQEVAYARAALPIAGWELLSATRDLVVFYKGAGTPAPKLWIRGEHYPLGPDNPIGSGESFVTVYDLDCAGARSRTISSTIYSGAKMQGDIVAASDKPGEWTPMKPGGFTALGAEAVCKPAAPAAPIVKGGVAQSLQDGKTALQTAAEHKDAAATPR